MCLSECVAIWLVQGTEKTKGIKRHTILYYSKWKKIFAYNILLLMIFILLAQDNKFNVCILPGYLSDEMSYIPHKT